MAISFQSKRNRLGEIAGAKNRSLNAEPSICICRHRFLGLRQYAGDYNLVERQPLDFVDDSAWNGQLVLCPVLRFLQIVVGQDAPTNPGVPTRQHIVCGCTADVGARGVPRRSRLERAGRTWADVSDVREKICN